jgi:glycosyltransferase involved in cell wall biosynthesis
MTSASIGQGKPRVLVLVENVPLGTDNRLKKQTRSLLASGFDVTVICRRHPCNKTCVPGVHVVQYPSPPEGEGLLAFVVEYGYSVAMAAVLTLWSAARRGFDVLQVASTPDIYFLVAAPCRWFGRPVVFDFRDPSPETYEARYGRRDSRIYRALLLLERWSFRVADRALVVNESLGTMARTRGGVADARIVLVGNGPEAKRITRRSARSDLRPARRYLSCWIGAIGPQDHVDLALRAIAYLVYELKRTDCAFAFVGVGEALPALQRLADDLGICDWVIFPGFVDEELVFDYLSTADIGIEPNTEDYVSGVKVMEYQAAGLPIIAFDTEETMHLAGDSARYAPKGDFASMARLIDELLDDPAARDEMGNIGQRRVKEFTAWELQAGRYISAIRELIDGREAGERA